MAKPFLDRLVKIPKGELSKESFCSICRQEYGIDAVDFAVRLPCDHHVGFDCISIWLSQESKNTCPLCRYVFFDVINEEQEEENQRIIVDRVGRPPQEGQSSGNSTGQQHTWYEPFVRAAAEQYVDSLIRARASLERTRPNYEAYELNYRATALRTLAVREMLLYMRFAREGAFPPVGPISGPLTAEQLEALFRELERRGAFNFELHPDRRYRDLTNRHMWLTHREEGESYGTFEGEGYWSEFLG